jgi:hypothetical protein
MSDLAGLRAEMAVVQLLESNALHRAWGLRKGGAPAGEVAQAMATANDMQHLVNQLQRQIAAVQTR